MTMTRKNFLLQLLSTSLPKNDMVIIERDWNACVGYDAAVVNSVIGTYEIEVRQMESLGELHT